MSETPTHEALRQCRDALAVALDLAIEQQNNLTNTLGDRLPHRHAAAQRDTETVRAALAAADAALSVQAEPVAWRFAGSYWTRYESIHEALRKQVEPLYATPQPPAPVPAVPLTDKQIGDLIPFTNRQHSGVNAWGLADMVWFARAIERAHNITGGSND